LNLTKFQDFLDNLSTNVFRGKGILWFAESELKHIFQLSGKRFSIDAEEWKNPQSNQIVLIGRNLDAKQLQQELTKCQELEPARTTQKSAARD
jgi:G3E family GTPase